MKIFLLTVMLFGFFPTVAKKASPDSGVKMGVKVGYVNLMQAFEATKKGKNVRAQLEKQTEMAKKKFKSMELQLQEEEASLKKSAPMLSDQAKAKKIQQLQQKILNFQKEAKAKDLELQKLQNDLMNPVIEKLKKVIGDVAKKESYTVIENIGADVLWVSPDRDLTNKISKAFNKKYK